MSETADETTRAPRRWVALILGCAFAIKLAVLMQLRDHPLLQPHGELDTAYYVGLARQMAAAGLFAPVDTSFVSPLYAYALATVFAAGGSVLAAQLLQIGLGTAAVYLSFATARYWFGVRAAAVAAGLAMLAGPFSFNEVLILQSALDPFLVAGALCLLTRALAGGATVAWAGAGATLGLLALNRPNALAFGVAAVAGVLIHQWRQASVTRGGGPRGWAATRGAALLAVSLLAVLAANAARTYAVSGQALLIASHGGLNLYIGNHDRADGTYTPVPGIRPSIAGQARDAARVAEAAEGRPLAAGEVSDFFARRAVDWIVARPADAARLIIRKALILLNSVDVPLNYSYAYYAADARSVLHWLVVGPWLILPLGIVGLLWPSVRAHRRGYWIWASFVPVYGASVIAFFVADRYRMPLLLPLCASAGAALVRAFDIVRARRLASLGIPAMAVAAISLIGFADLGLDDGIGGEQTRWAVALVERGEYDDARRYAEEVLPGQRRPGVMWFRVGHALLDARRHADAADALARAMTIDGPRPAIQLALGEALAGAGRARDAVEHLEAALTAGFQPDVSGPLLVRSLVAAGRADEAVARLAHVPDSAADAGPDEALDFGTLALDRGAPRDAARWLRIAVARAPDRAEAQEALGLALFLQDDPASALPLLERARQLGPERASAHLNLAAVYAALGRTADARTSAREALRLDPAERRAAELLKAIQR